MIKTQTSNAGDVGSVPGLGTKIPHAVGLSQKLKKKKLRTNYVCIVYLLNITHPKNYSDTKVCVQKQKQFTSLFFNVFLNLYTVYFALCDY